MNYNDYHFHYIPSAINKELTEEQIIELYQALVAVEKPGHTLEQAIEIANIISYATFRNVLDYFSVLQWIVAKSKQVQIT